MYTPNGCGFAKLQYSEGALVSEPDCEGSGSETKGAGEGLHVGAFSISSEL